MTLETDLKRAKDLASKHFPDSTDPNLVLALYDRIVESSALPRPQPKDAPQHDLAPAMTESKQLEAELTQTFGKPFSIVPDSKEFKPIKGVKLPTFANKYPNNPCKVCGKRLGDTYSWIKGFGTFHPDCSAKVAM